MILLFGTKDDKGESTIFLEKPLQEKSPGDESKTEFACLQCSKKRNAFFFHFFAHQKGEMLFLQLRDNAAYDAHVNCPIASINQKNCNGTALPDNI